MISDKPLPKFTNKLSKHRFDTYFEFNYDIEKLLDFIKTNRIKYRLKNNNINDLSDILSTNESSLLIKIFNDFKQEHPQYIENAYDHFLKQEGRHKRRLIDIPDPAYKDGYFEHQQLIYEIIKSNHLASLQAALSSLEVDLDWIVQRVANTPTTQGFRQEDRLSASIEKIAPAITGADASEQIHYNHTVAPISEAVRKVYEELIRYIARHPKALYQIKPRQFEELIAEILSSFEWDIELTQESSDGGCDIIAVSKDIGNTGIRTSYVIECKKYSPERKVGISVVRQLLHVKTELKASHAILATTSDFTKGVYDYSINRMDFDLKNFEAILEWCKLYSQKQG